jgi:DNA segregation ATPase FtsK/SpoIIIE-like protein
MFTGGLLDVLKNGHPGKPEWLSLNDLQQLITIRLQEQFAEKAVLPEVNSPQQRMGRVDIVPLFRNPAMFLAARRTGKEKRQIEAAERARHAEEEKRQIEAAGAGRRAKEEVRQIEAAEAARHVEEEKRQTEASEAARHAEEEKRQIESPEARASTSPQPFRLRLFIWEFVWETTSFLSALRRTIKFLFSKWWTIGLLLSTCICFVLVVAWYLVCDISHVVSYVSLPQSTPSPKLPPEPPAILAPVPAPEPRAPQSMFDQAKAQDEQWQKERLELRAKNR